MDDIDLVAEEGQTVRMVIGIRKDVDDGSADRKLARRRHEIHFFEALSGEGIPDGLEPDPVARAQRQDRPLHFPFSGNRFFHRFRIGHDEEFFRRGEDFRDGRGPLDAQRGFVIAPFDGFSRIRKVEYAVPFHNII